MRYKDKNEAERFALEILKNLPVNWRYNIISYKENNENIFRIELENTVLFLKMEISNNYYFVSSTQSIFDVSGISNNVEVSDTPIGALKDFQERIRKLALEALKLSDNIFK